MQRIIPRYQIINDTLMNSRLGYEATIQGLNQDSAQVLFKKAEQKGMEAVVKLDYSARIMAVEKSRSLLREEELLFLNVSSLDALLHDSVIYPDELLKNRLVFEITESVRIDSKAIQTIRKLSEKGMRFAIDDFGKGHANWKSFIDLPVSFVKMDMYFVQNINNPKARDIIKAMVELCENRKIGLITEGVETADQYRELRSLDCRYMQGFFFGRPMTSSKLLLKINHDVIALIEA